jgi:putative spermidine/putrescine transport system ATP-binding protein
MTVPATGPIVEFDHVVKRYGGTAAVDAVSFAIAEGEFFSMLGPSGSGKTTCLRLIGGFEQPDSGRVLLHGRDVAGLAPFRRDVNTVFQDYALFPHLSVRDNVTYGLRMRGTAPAEAEAAAVGMLELVQLASLGSRRPAQLSGGQRQRVALARALVNKPSVLLLDEPLGALDLKLREEMQGELKALQRKLGITFVFVTHDQGEALSMSDRVAVFNAGRIEQLDTPRNLYARPATEFVARFVGSANVLKGAVATRLLGRAGCFALRAEHIELGRPGTPPRHGELTCAGTVLDVQYHGATTRVRVAAGVDSIVNVQQTETAAPEWLATGANVELRFSELALVPVRESP